MFETEINQGDSKLNFSLILILINYKNLQCSQNNKFVYTFEYSIYFDCLNLYTTPCQCAETVYHSYSRKIFSDTEFENLHLSHQYLVRKSWNILNFTWLPSFLKRTSAIVYVLSDDTDKLPILWNTKF